jgi:hypothetical protein
MEGFDSGSARRQVAETVGRVECFAEFIIGRAFARPVGDVDRSVET